MLLHRRQGLDFNFSWDSFVCHLTKNVSKGAYCSTSELLLLLSTSIVAADVMAQALFYLILYVVNCVITFELFVTTVVLNVCCCCSYFCLLLLVYRVQTAIVVFEEGKIKMKAGKNICQYSTNWTKVLYYSHYFYIIIA